MGLVLVPLLTYIRPDNSLSRSLPARKDTGLAALSSAGTPSTCTAMRPAHIPTMQGSNAPASLVDEGPSQGSVALEDWQP